jgi:ketosteroid isomerase-like protein
MIHPIPTAAESFERIMPALCDNKLDDLLDQCTADVVFEYPFAPAGRPRRLQGRDAVKNYLASIYAHIRIERVEQLTIHQTVTPTVAVAEFTVAVRVGEASTTVSASYVGILTIRDGLISHYRDYWNPLALALGDKR